MFEGFARKQIEAGDAIINCVVAGSGLPVLMLHGFPQNLAMWAKVAPKLAEKFTVVCADLRGYGDSSKPAWLFAAELREGTVLRLLTPFERTVPILAVRPAAAGCPPKYAFSLNTWIRLSRFVLSSIHHLAKTVAGCSTVKIGNLKSACRERPYLPDDGLTGSST